MKNPFIYFILFFSSNLLNCALREHFASGLMYKIQKHSIKTKGSAFQGLGLAQLPLRQSLGLCQEASLGRAPQPHPTALRTPRV